MSVGKVVAWTLGIGIILWVGIAFFAFAHDAPARKYAATATSTAPVQQPDSGFNMFFWGYMMGGGFGHSGYTTYRTTTNNTYYGSSEYSDHVREVQSGTWGTDDSKGDVGSSGWSWNSSSDDGSWGSGRSGSSWDSSDDDSGSWGGSSGSSWDSSDSGSWGGSSESSSWSSEDSGSWGD